MIHIYIYIYIHVFFWQPKFYTLLSEYQWSRKWQSAQTLIVWSPCPLWLFSNCLSWWYLIATMTNWVYIFWTKDLRFLQLGEFWFYNGSPPRMFLPLVFLLDYWIGMLPSDPLEFVLSFMIFCNGVPGFAADCLWGVWWINYLPPVWQSNLWKSIPLLGNLV